MTGAILKMNDRTFPCALVCQAFGVWCSVFFLRGGEAGRGRAGGIRRGDRVLLWRKVLITCFKGRFKRHDCILYPVAVVDEIVHDGRRISRIACTWKLMGRFDGTSAWLVSY